MTSADFFRPTSTEQACSLLARYGADASVLAGGTDLMVAVNQAQRRSRSWFTSAPSASTPSRRPRPT